MSLVRKLILGSFCFVASGPSLLRAQPAEDPTTGPIQINLAAVATPSSSFTSGDTTVAALNDGVAPRNSRDNRRGSYGNWPQKQTQWVEYDWSQPISTNKIDVYFWADGQGVHLPKAMRVEYWNGNAFAPVANASGLGLTENQFNTTTFDAIRTNRLRVELDGDGTNSTGILEWKVYDTGESPKFAPSVNAGIDRVVVVGGKTYLNGTLRSLYGPSGASLLWSKQSGPGSVTFENATDSSAAASFSAPGKYVLQLTATEGNLKASGSVNVRVEPAPAGEHLEPVYTTQYKIDSPLWGNRTKTLITNWIPHCYNMISDVNLKEGGINNFIQAGNKLAGKPYTPHVGYPFSNAWVHNTVEAMCVALMVDPQGDPQIIAAQQAMREKLNEWIPIILAAQEPDGYLQTRFTLGTARENPNNPAQHWNARTRGEHEGYVAGYFLESAIAHYLMTDGKDLRLYNAAKKLADCWYDNIGPAPKKEWYDGHEEMEQALVRFGRFVEHVEGAGKGRKYIELAQFLLDCRKNGSAYDQTQAPVVQQYEAVGHAVRAAYLFSAMTDVAMETGNLDYHSAVQSLWDNVVNRKLYITGGIGSGETSEGFGPDYSLRNNAYCESCSNCGELFFQYKMNLMYRDGKYADLYEQTLYNAILGDTDLTGDNFTYTNALESGGARYAWHSCPCCVGNIPRTLLMLPTWMYATSKDALYVNLYLGSTVRIADVAGASVEVVQKTDYPWSGMINLTINPGAPKNFAVKLRVPDRTVSDLYSATPAKLSVPKVAVNGSMVPVTIEAGYITISRNWMPGDKIQMELPMDIQRFKAIDKIAADRGRVALQRGPILYNIESVDQNINSVLASDAPLQSEWRPDLLGGVMVITGKYADGSPLLAIPNYVRSNRGGRTAVWIHDQ